MRRAELRRRRVELLAGPGTLKQLADAAGITESALRAWCARNAGSVREAAELARARRVACQRELIQTAAYVYVTPEFQRRCALATRLTWAESASVLESPNG